MEKRYYLNKNKNRSGVHEVHREDCFYLPLEMNRIFLGLFSDSYEAVDVGRGILSDVGKCMKCLGNTERFEGNKKIDIRENEH